MMGDTAFEPAGRAGKSAWGWVLAYGILVIFIGLLALFNPLATGLATGIMFGALLLIYGVFAVISGFSSMAGRGRWIEILLGLLAIAGGIAVLLAPYAGAWSLVWALGFWLIVSGVFQVIAALQSSIDKGWRLFLGILDIVLGGILVFADPASSLLYLAVIVGISFIFRGVFLVSLAFVLRKLTRA